MVLQAIRWDHEAKTLYVLDQLKLPHVETYDQILTVEDGWHSIRDMRVRGAPAIAIVAALSLAADLSHNPPQDVFNAINTKLDHLESSRPTAVNLADAVRKLKRISQDAWHGGVQGKELINVYVNAAEKMLVSDVADNEAIGKHGAEWILLHAASPSPSSNGTHSSNTNGNSSTKVSILTHCNTGSLATAGHGTALGIVRSLHQKGDLHHAYCTETRPYNQGARLTAFELVHDNIPATLITDSMAGALLAGSKADSGRIAAIVVGADRVAENGDTANKIGTYALAVLAKFHGVKFLVAAPRTTIDLSTPSGKQIKIEERKKEELTTVRGPVLDARMGKPDVSRTETVVVAASGIDVWNPAFDVTPAELIDGVVTEVGVFEKDGQGQFHLEDAFKR